MFVSFDPDWPPPPERRPRPPSRQIDRRQERRLFQAISINAVLLLIAPIGGATLFTWLAALLD